MTRPVLLLAACLLLPSCDKAPAVSEGATPPTKTQADAPDPAPAEDGAKAPAAAAEQAEPPAATAVVGKPAPDFTLTDVAGKTHTLSEHAGKTVVLEWFNPQCPFVKYSHTEGPLATMAKEQLAKDVVWLSVNSGAPGKQGHGVEANTAGIEQFGMVNPVLLDEDGAVGHAYGALKTPHVFVVDPKGTLVYAGAIDNAPIGEVDGGGETIGYVANALEDLRAGNAVTVAETAPYGCTVKYAKG